MPDSVGDPSARETAAILATLVKDVPNMVSDPKLAGAAIADVVWCSRAARRALVIAVEVGLPEELRRTTDPVNANALHSLGVHRLVAEGVAKDLAGWVVAAWAMSLGSAGVKPAAARNVGVPGADSTPPRVKRSRSIRSSAPVVRSFAKPFPSGPAGTGRTGQTRESEAAQNPTTAAKLSNKSGWTGIGVRTTPQNVGLPPPLDPARSFRWPWRRVRPYPFCGQKFTDWSTLAAEMAAEWDAAIDVVGLDLEAFANWIAQFPATSHMPRVLASLQNGRWRPDRAVTELLCALDPRRDPTFCGVDVQPAALPGLAEQAMDGDERSRDIIDRLNASRAFVALAALEGCDELAIIDDAWQGAQIELRRLINSPRVPAHVKNTLTMRGPIELLLIVVSSEAAQQNAVQAARATTSTACGPAWFLTIAQEQATQLDPGSTYARDLFVRYAGPSAEAEESQQRAARRQLQKPQKQSTAKNLARTAVTKTLDSRIDVAITCAHILVLALIIIPLVVFAFLLISGHN